MISFRALDDLLGTAKSYTLEGSLKDANRQLLERFATTGSAADLRELVERNLPLVQKIAKSYFRSLGNDLAYEDLVAAGQEGLLVAIRRFRASTGNTLSTYASHWIRSCIRREIDRCGFRIRIPTHLVEKILRVCAAERAEQRRMSCEELATWTGYSVDAVRQILSVRSECLSSFISLDRPVDSSDRQGSSAIVDLIAPPEVDQASYAPDSRAVQEDLCKRIRLALEILTPVQREVVIRRFGLFGCKAETLETIGNYLNVTRERVRQLEKKALGRLSRTKRTYFGSPQNW